MLGIYGTSSTIAGMVCRHCGRGGTCAPRSGNGRWREVELGRARVAETRVSPDARRRLVEALEAPGVQARTDHAGRVVER